MNRNCLLALALFVAAATIALPAFAQGAVADKWRWLTFLVFGAIIAVTMFVTYLAAKRVKITRAGIAG